MDREKAKEKSLKKILEETKCPKCGTNMLLNFNCCGKPKNPSCLCGYTNIKG